MAIRQIETFVVGQQLAKPFSFAQWRYDRRSACLVRVTTEDGAYGWGEGYGPAEVVQAGIEFFAPLLIGQDPLHQETLWQRMHLRSYDYARSGVLLAALSALDVALWDLKGKLLGQPVSILLGGRRRDRVRVYATGMYFTDGDDLPGRLAEEARSYVDQGFTALKMKVGLGIREDQVNVRAVRRATGPETELMVDADRAYARHEALWLARALEPENVAWLEQPLTPDDYEGYRELRQLTSIPIAAGECEYLVAGFRRLFENQCVDIAQPDICAAGGLTEMKRIVALARAFTVNVTPHCWGTGIAFAAGLHLVSGLDVIPGRLRSPDPVLEMDRSESPLRDALTIPRFEVQGGTVLVPTAPGLGVDIDPVVLKQFQVCPAG